MQINERFSPATPAQHLFYAGRSQSKVGEYFRNRVSACHILSVKELQETISKNKLAPIYPGLYSCSDPIWKTPLPTLSLGVAAVLSIMGVIMVSLFYWLQLSDREVRVASKSPEFCPACFIDARTGQPAPNGVIYRAFFERGGSFTMPLMVAVVGVTFGCIILIEMLYKHVKEGRYNHSVEKHNAQIDVLLNRLSFVSSSGEEPAPARDVALSFCYLSDEQLEKLDFTQLFESHEHRRELFLEKLSSCKFSRELRAVFRLYNHLLRTDSDMQCKILTEVRSRALLRQSTPLFFQKLMVALKPLSFALQSLSIDILQKEILKPRVVKQLSEEKLSGIILQLTQGIDFSQAVAAALSSQTTVKVCQDDTFDQFMQTRKLVIHSPDECYQHYMRSLKIGDAALIAWFESYLGKHLDDLVQPERLQSVLVDLTDLKADGLKIKIDAYLAKRPLHRFDSLAFREAYLMSRKHALYLYEEALVSHYSKSLQKYTLQGSTAAVVQCVKQFLNEFDDLFSHIKRDFELILAKCVASFLHRFPQNIDALTLAAKDVPWLLSVIGETYSKNVNAFSKYCLFPLDEVINHS